MKKILLLFLAAIVCLELAACQLSGEQSDTTESTSEITPAETEPPVLPVSIIQDGATEYKIIRPERAGTALVAAASEFRSDLSEATGVQIKIETDWYKTGDEPPETAKEIVVGKCDRPAIDTIVKTCVSATLQSFIWASIYIVGGNDEATIEGIDYFVANYVDTSAKTVIVPSNLSYIQKYEYPLGMVSVNGVNITEYRIVIPDGCGLYTSSAAECLSDYLFYNGGISLEIVKDTEAEQQYEILVGSTNRAESKTASAVTLGADQYILACTNSKIVITGNSYMVGGGQRVYQQLRGSRGENVDIDIKTCRRIIPEDLCLQRGKKRAAPYRGRHGL